MIELIKLKHNIFEVKNMVNKINYGITWDCLFFVNISFHCMTYSQSESHSI